jgi:hypothetical protein
MKYLINENQLDRLIYRYLDSVFENSKTEKGAVLFDILVIEDGEEAASIGIDLEGDRVVSSIELRQRLKSMFSIDESYANNIVGKYIKEKLNLN